jgi:hypothetical protein
VKPLPLLVVDVPFYNHYLACKDITRNEPTVCFRGSGDEFMSLTPLCWTQTERHGIDAEVDETRKGLTTQTSKAGCVQDVQVLSSNTT